MLRFDPFRDLDAVTSSLLGTQSGTDRSPRFMPMDLYKVDDHYVLDADLPG
ncbi:MAG: Hsp20/alpha crystallin family protein, partial [Rhodococcus sp. (in: high G+C Gram-positive bacteria)]